MAVGPMIKSRLYPGGDPRASHSREREREDLSSSCETRRCKSLDFTGDSRRNDVSFLKGISTGTNGYAAHGRLLNFKRSSSLFREMPPCISLGCDRAADRSPIFPLLWEFRTERYEAWWLLNRRGCGCRGLGLI